MAWFYEVQFPQIFGLPGSGVVLLHFGFNIVYVFWDADIGFFVILTVLYLIVTPIAVWIRNKTAEGLLKNDRSREKKITNGENRMDTLPCLM